MARALPFLVAAALFAYPFAVYFGLRHWGLGGIAPVLLGLFALRFFTTRGGLAFSVARLFSIAGAALVALSWIFRQNEWMLYYPVAVSLLLLSGFVWSLFKPPTAIERLARLKDPDLPPEGVRYTRRVTQVWCAFFIFNGSISLATCLHGDLAIWTFYNGALSYILIALLFSGEWLLRRRLTGKPKDKQP
ncbi:MAG: hypothetical protein LBV54_04775 [Puniceicoccales bacterium]|jgi:uncharacterized membrane protein|nr:hypothetical protein [Puniceicoccales bacterium]